MQCCVVLPLYMSEKHLTWISKGPLMRMAHVLVGSVVRYSFFSIPWEILLFDP